MRAFDKYVTNALEFRHDHGSFMIDPYVSRNREKLVVPEETEKYLTSAPDFVLMTHAHWDHLPDMPGLIAQTGTVLYASRTACNIMRSLGVTEKNLYQLLFGEELKLPGGVRMMALESRHMGTIPEPSCYDFPPSPEALRSAKAWRCGEVFSFLFEVEDKKILNIGSANLHEASMHGIRCDYLIAGISRWEPGFPELLSRNIHFHCLIPTHHDKFTLPLSQFHLRDDLERLKEVLPGLKYKELKVLDWLSL